MSTDCKVLVQDKQVQYHFYPQAPYKTRRDFWKKTACFFIADREKKSVYKRTVDFRHIVYGDIPLQAYNLIKRTIQYKIY